MPVIQTDRDVQAVIGYDGTHLLKPAEALSNELGYAVVPHEKFVESVPVTLIRAHGVRLHAPAIVGIDEQDLGGVFRGEDADIVDQTPTLTGLRVASWHQRLPNRRGHPGLAYQACRCVRPWSRFRPPRKPVL